MSKSTKFAGWTFSTGSAASCNLKNLTQSSFGKGI
jgi:hypothetical protein